MNRLRTRLRASIADGPLVLLDFISGGLDPRITFSRGTTATFVGSNGLIQTAAINAPRFDYDPVTLAPKGLLIEEQRTNLVTYSEQFGSWTNSGATVTANSIAAPSGETTADTIVRVGFTSDAIYNTATFTGDGVKAVSLWIKKGTSPSTLIALLDATASVYRLWADVTWSGTTPSLAFTNGSLISSTNYGNGWWRLELATTAVTAANSNRVYVYPGRTGSVNGDTVYCWGAQAENASFATSYIPTVASTVTRSADVATMTGTNFSSWYNQSASTLVISATGYNAPTVAQGGTAPTPVSFYATAAVSPYAAIAISRRDNTTLNSPSGFILSDAGTLGADIQINTVSWVGATVTAAIAWNGSTDAAFTANGAAVGTDASYTLPTPDSLQIGRWGSEAVTGYWSGHIRSIRYYPTRLTNAQLQALTA